MRESMKLPKVEIIKSKRGRNVWLEIETSTDTYVKVLTDSDVSGLHSLLCEAVNGDFERRRVVSLFPQPGIGSREENEQMVQSR